MKIGVFAGTTEGRKILDFLNNTNAFVDAFVATEQGKEVLPSYDNANICVGRLDENQMDNLFKNNNYDLIVDATHPYADIVTKNIKSACIKENIEYIRVVRDLSYEGTCFENVEEIIEYLNQNDGKVLLTTGSKDLMTFSKMKDFANRVYARVLPTLPSIEECIKAGLDMDHIIAMKGPFSKDLNISMINNLKVSYMVTKLGGKSGGFDEKKEACIATNIKLLVVDKKDENIGLSLEETISFLKTKLCVKKKVFLVGIGMGNSNSLTIEAKNIIEKADVLIGAKRMLEPFYNKNKLEEYRSKEIASYIDNTNYNNYVILFSGDVGYYSGAIYLNKELKNVDIKFISGISTYVYFSSKLGIDYEDMKLISLHGRKQNAINYISKNRKVFTLISDNGVNELLEKMIEYGLDDTTVYVGENLSYSDEKISYGRPSELINKEYSKLSSIIIINDNYENTVSYGFDDNCFIKESSPMTKMEVRSVSLSKLNLNKDSICYDVGAGTGSVSVEMARLCEDGIVYAIEKEHDAIDTIKKNKNKFKVQNLEIIEGFAPDALKDLSSPTHAFIGGSSGNLNSIVKCLLEKNEKIRIVINAITLESISEAYKVAKEFDLEMDVVTITSAKSKALGNYNLMMGQNPVYIFTLNHK